MFSSQLNNRLANTTYDAMGKQTQLSVSAGTLASYDAENRMSQIKVGASVIATYTYDAEGRRVAKKVGATTTYYFYDAVGQLMAEYGGPAQTAGTHYFATDYLGSTRMILSATGGCVERLDYAPFGGQISRSGYDCYGGASSEKPLFTGQMRDGESNAGTDTGQDFFKARYFWANTARFTSPDAPFADQRPEDGQSWNMYAYVRNNPLRFVDPSGRTCQKQDDGTTYNDLDGKGCTEIDQNPVGDSTTSGAGDVHPIQVGVEWVTGTGPRQRTFTGEDQFTEMLRTHSHMQLVLGAISTQLGNCQVPTPDSLREAGTNPNYNLGGFGGVPKYVGDYSTLATGGATGNLAVTYLGSYSVGFDVRNINRSTGTASVSFSVSNSSTFASATRPPVLGYTQAWKGTVGDTLNSWLARGVLGSGAMSSTQQDFFWTERVSFQGGQCR
jgi:RHS repeat-associated protein